MAAARIPVLPRPVHLRSLELAPGQRFKKHAHSWHQLVYATSGLLVVTLEAMRHVITPQQAIWLPAKTVHATASFGGASFRSLWIAQRPDLSLPLGCKVLEVSALLRALIVELDAASLVGDNEAYFDQLDALILVQLQRARPTGAPLPWAASEPLRRLCQALYDDPGDTRTVDMWGRELAMSPRTIARRFEAETGLSLRAWRGRLRIFRALEWLGSGRSVTQVALDLGYAAPSAFTYMFRSETGASPSEWRRRTMEATIANRGDRS